MKNYIVTAATHDMQGIVYASSPKRALEKYLNRRNCQFHDTWTVNELVSACWYHARYRDGKHEIEDLKKKVYTGYRGYEGHPTTLAEMIKHARLKEKLQELK